MPLAVVYVASLVWTPLFYARNLVICMPACYLLLARALFLLFAGRRFAAAAACSILAAVFLGYLFFGLDYYQRAEKEQYRESARYALSRAEPRTLFVQCSWSGWDDPRYPDRRDYYFEGSGKGPGMQACTPGEVRAASERFEAGSYRRVVYLRAHIEPSPDVARTLRKEFGVPREHKEFVQAEVRVFEPQGAGEG